MSRHEVRKYKYFRNRLLFICISSSQPLVYEPCPPTQYVTYSAQLYRILAHPYRWIWFAVRASTSAPAAVCFRAQRHTLRRVEGTPGRSTKYILRKNKYLAIPPPMSMLLPRCHIPWSLLTTGRGTSGQASAPSCLKVVVTHFRYIPRLTAPHISAHQPRCDAQHTVDVALSRRELT